MATERKKRGVRSKGVIIIGFLYTIETDLNAIQISFKCDIKMSHFAVSLISLVSSPISENMLKLGRGEKRYLFFRYLHQSVFKIIASSIKKGQNILNIVSYSPTNG